MKKILLSFAATIFLGLSITSCNDNSTDVSNPFEAVKKGEFYPSAVKVEKSTESTDINEEWTNITRDNKKRIVGYSYKYRIDGDFLQEENRNTKIVYFPNHLGNDVINTTTTVEYKKSDRGIEERYTQNVREDITINSNGYINKITTTIAHLDDGATEPVMKTSERNFNYSGDYCTGSVYLDDVCRITYSYNWSGYQLANITVLKENFADGSIEYNTFDYTFDDKEIYPYSGTEPMPFIQSGFPCIFASMGYLGKCTPYVLIDEKQGGYTKFDNITSNNPKVNNTYSLDGDSSFKIKYTAISNIFNTYDITFCK